MLWEPVDAAGLVLGGLALLLTLVLVLTLALTLVLTLVLIEVTEGHSAGEMNTLVGLVMSDTELLLRLSSLSDKKFLLNAKIIFFK